MILVVMRMGQPQTADCLNSSSFSSCCTLTWSFKILKRPRPACSQVWRVTCQTGIWTQHVSPVYNRFLLYHVSKPSSCLSLTVHQTLEYFLFALSQSLGKAAKVLGWGGVLRVGGNRQFSYFECDPNICELREASPLCTVEIFTLLKLLLLLFFFLSKEHQFLCIWHDFFLCCLRLRRFKSLVLMTIPFTLHFSSSLGSGYFIPRVCTDVHSNWDLSWDTCVEHGDLGFWIQSFLMSILTEGAGWGARQVLGKCLLQTFTSEEGTLSGAQFLICKMRWLDRIIGFLWPMELLEVPLELSRRT